MLFLYPFSRKYILNKKQEERKG